MSTAQIAAHQRKILNISQAENIFDPLRTAEDPNDENRNSTLDQLPAKLTDLFGRQTPHSIIRLLNSAATIKRHLIIFNGIQQNAAMNGTGKMQFDMTFTAATGSIAQGNCTAKWPETCAWIVGIRYAGGMRMPTVSLSLHNNDLGLWYSNVFQSMRQINICIEEFVDQAFIGPPYPAQSTPGSIATRNQRFHFIADMSTQDREFNIIQNVPFVDLDPQQFGQGFYWFARPYIPPQTITMSFAAPFIPFDLPGTVVTLTASVNFANQLQGTLVGYTQVRGPLYVRGFTTTDPEADAILIETVNTVLHTDVTVFGELTFVFNDVDLTGVTLPADLQIVCYSTRQPMYIVPIEFYYVEKHD